MGTGIKRIAFSLLILLHIEDMDVPICRKRSETAVGFVNVGLAVVYGMARYIPMWLSMWLIYYLLQKCVSRPPETSLPHPQSPSPMTPSTGVIEPHPPETSLPRRQSLSPTTPSTGVIETAAESSTSKQHVLPSGQGEIDSVTDIFYDWYEDPITWAKMCDPVKCSDGLTYDRWTIVEHRGLITPGSCGTPLRILCDDISLRSRLFDAFPEQESKFRDHREKYIRDTLQYAHEQHAGSEPVKLKDALEKLNDVIRYQPLHSECLKERDTIRCLMSQQSSLQNRPSRQRVPTEVRPYEIPVVMHEDLIRARENTFEARLAKFLVMFYIGIWFFIM